MKLSSQIEMGVGEPLDSRFSVDTYTGLLQLASSGKAYAYMRVVNKWDGYTYELQPDMSTWKLYTAKGPKGDKGDKGDPGKDGTNGKDGKDGTNGKDGKDGEPGPALEVGEVSLVSGEEADLEIWKGSDGKLNFKLTLPSYIIGE